MLYQRIKRSVEFFVQLEKRSWIYTKLPRYDMGIYKSGNYAEEQSYNWLLENIDKDKDQEFPGDGRHCSLLQFWSGWSMIPFEGHSKMFKVKFIADDDRYNLPISSACSVVLRLPTVYTSELRLFRAMNIACEHWKF